MRRVYLDNAASTPTRQEAIEAMMPYFAEFSGNPSSPHSYGHQSKSSMSSSHASVAGIIGCAQDEVVFTGSGTEANNAVIKGTAEALKNQGKHIITSAVEHHAVIEPCRYLEQRDYRITFLPVDGYGMVDPEDVRRAITGETILITIMHANNEVGTIQPVEEIGKIARSYEVPFHSDGIQMMGHLPVNVNELGVQFYSMSAHKFYGPKGVGALYIKKDVAFTPLLHGGGQERGLRSGTPNVPGAAGLSKALELAMAECGEQRQHLRDLRHRLVEGLCSSVRGIKLNGHPTKTLPHIVNLSVDGVNSDELIQALDEKGVYISKGAACGSGKTEPSHVLLAMGLSPRQAHSAVRLSLGRWNTVEDVDYVVQVFTQAAARLRKG